MPKRPSVVSVLGRNYTIVEADLSDASAYGTCNGARGEIRIDTPACASKHTAQDTLLHEVMHAICRQQGRAYSKAEETVVTALATGLLPVLQNNPALVAYLRS